MDAARARALTDHRSIEIEGRLRAVERIRGGGRDQDNVWVFERQ